MDRPTSSRRIALFALTLLSACAAGGGAHSGEGGSGIGLSKDNPWGAYLVGRFAGSEADSDTAAAAMLKVQRADPKDPEVAARTFIAAVLDNRPEAPDLARQQPGNPLAALLLGGDDARSGRWDRAQARFAGMPSGTPLSILQPVMLAWAQLGHGNAAQALETLRPLTDSGPMHALFALHAALIADQANQPAVAAGYFKLVTAGESAPPTLRVAMLGAGILNRAGQRDAAEALLNSVSLQGGDLALALAGKGRDLALNTRLVATPLQGMAEAEQAMAVAVQAQGAPDFALLLARLALRVDPQSGPGRLMAADALAQAGHPDGALAELDRVAPTDPLAPVAQLQRATLLDSQGKTDAAAAILQKLSADYPTLPQPSARLGDLMRQHNRFPEAVAAYDEALKRIPQPGPADWSLFYARGVAEERAKQWDKAEADFQQALKLSPDQPYVLNYLAYSWAEQGSNLDRARAMLERAAALRPQDGNIADSLGWVLYRQGDMPSAVLWLEKAAALEPRSATVNDHLGDAYWAVGRHREAQFQWRRALTMELEPGQSEAIEAKVKNGLPTPPATHALR